MKYPLIAISFVASLLVFQNIATSQEFAREPASTVEVNLVKPVSALLSAAQRGSSQSASDAFLKAIWSDESQPRVEVDFSLQKRPNGPMASPEDAMTVTVGIEATRSTGDLKGKSIVFVFLLDERNKTANCWSRFGGNLFSVEGSVGTVSSTRSFSRADAFDKELVCVVLLKTFDSEHYALARVKKIRVADLPRSDSTSSVGEVQGSN